jgi:phospholipase A-2-activating protein
LIITQTRRRSKYLTIFVVEKQKMTDNNFPPPFTLKSVLIGHSKEVRTLALLSDGQTIISGGRDNQVRVWGNNNSADNSTTNNSNTNTNDDVNMTNNTQLPTTTYQELSVIRDFQSWVLSLVGMDNLSFVAGCQDGTVRIFNGSWAFEASMGGHTASVNCLTRLPLLGNDFIASGSWDGTARIWNITSKTCTRILPGHENAVNILCLGNFFITSSSGQKLEGDVVGNVRLRVWPAQTSRLDGHGKESPVVIFDRAKPGEDNIHDYHTNSIRALCELSTPFSFASTSNDGSTRKYMIDNSSGALTCFSTCDNPPGFEGTPAFNYTCCSIRDPSGRYPGLEQVMVGSDDLCARIWDIDSNVIIQQINHPSAVWALLSLPNGDVVTACADGLVRVFTRDPNNALINLDGIQAFEGDAQSAREIMIAKLSGNGAQALDPNQFTPIESAPPGKSDQAVAVYLKNGKPWAYQWMAASQTWMEIGEAMGGVGDNRETLDNVAYDKVVAVAVDDPNGSGGTLNLKLGFNYNDNPWIVANEFVKKHDLGEHNVQQIVEFIYKQGGGKSIVGNSSSAAATSSSSSSSNNPPSSKKLRSFPPFPDALGVVFDKGNLDKCLQKIMELSASQRDPIVNDVNSKKELEGIVEILKQTSRYHASSFSEKQMDILCKRLMSWDLKDRFPALDLIRAVLTHPDSGVKFSGTRGQVFFVELCQMASAKGATVQVQLTATRAATNFFRFSGSNSAALTAVKDHQAPLDVLCSALAPSQESGVRFAVASLVLNVSNALCQTSKRSDRDTAVVAQCVRGISTILQHTPKFPLATVGGGVADDEITGLRCLLGLGCCALVEPNIVKSKLLTEIKANAVERGERCEKVWQEITELLG